MGERERRFQEEAQQRQMQLEQLLREQQQMHQQIQQQWQMMSWFMNQALLISPPGSLPTPPFAFAWVSG
jgi:hypothetical protein